VFAAGEEKRMRTIFQSCNSTLGIQPRAEMRDGAFLVYLVSKYFHYNRLEVFPQKACFSSGDWGVSPKRLTWLARGAG
jgi:hypothetical protein